MEPEIVLTPREARVTKLIAQGLTPGEIASEIGIRRRSVMTTLWKVRGKLGLQSNGDISRYVSEYGLPEAGRKKNQQDLGARDPFFRLGAAVLLQSIKDVESQELETSGDAIAFLAIGGGLDLAEALGFDRGRVQQWLESVW